MSYAYPTTVRTPLETELEVEKAELDKFNRAHESSSR